MPVVSPDRRTTIIKPTTGWGWPDLRELFAYRELLWVLTRRDIQVRYKQTLLGIAWVAIQPVTTMVVFTLIFGKLAKMPSDGLPYPIFVMCALLPWQYFARALTEGSTSLVGTQSTLTKVYLPRVYAPGSEILSGLVNFAISFAILVCILLW